jgi:hypothetical protein
MSTKIDPLLPGAVSDAIAPEGMHIRKMISPETTERMYALPLRVTNKLITVWVHPLFARYFTREDAPDILKERLAMIGACDNKYLEVDDTSIGWGRNAALREPLYLASLKECPAGFEQIGWRVTKRYYYVVIPEQILMEWKGDRS